MHKKTLLLSLVSFLTVGCANQSLNIKPRAEVQPQYLSDKELPGISSEEIEGKIKRSDNLSTGFMSGAYLEVTPSVGALLFANENERLKEKTFKEKLDSGQVERERKKIQSSVSDSLKKGRCFVVFFRSSEAASYQNENEWHGQVSINGKDYPLTFSKFVGFVNTTTTVRGYGNYYSASDTHQYNVASSACTKNLVNLEDGFKLVIEPRFKEGIKPIEFLWAAPGTLPKEPK